MQTSLPEVGGDAILYASPNKWEEFAEKMNLVLSRKWNVDEVKYDERIKSLSGKLLLIGI
jgi:hypothetical protein